MTIRRLARCRDDRSRPRTGTPRLASSLDAGDSVAIMRQEGEISPAQAAKLLGVSRQYVDRLVEADVLPSRRLTNSSYRRIPVRAVIAHRTTSERKRAGITAIIDDALDAGLPY